MGSLTHALTALRQRATTPVDIASLAFFRIAFGGLMCVAALRFFWHGWIDALYVKPTFFFTYYGFSWVTPLPGWGMKLLFGAFALSALGIALGAWTRWSTGVFLLVFTYIELIDKTNYLNHYYLVSVLAFLMLWMPMGAAYSIDAWRDPSARRETAPAWCLWCLRLQLGLVYFFAGLAKLVPHWLFDAQPLKIWLAAKADFPLIGPLFIQPWFVHGMSLAGAAFDLSIAFCLLHRKLRPWAYFAVIGFHSFTGLLFPIGMFPWLMIALTSIFFSPSWPRRWWPRKALETTAIDETDPPYLSWFWWRLALGVLCVHFALQLLLPLRGHLYPGDIHWHEQGYRFSWRVMLIEKNGYIDFVVTSPKHKKRWILSGHEELTPPQVKMMSTQPDMILTYAHHLARRYRERGFSDVEVRVRSYVSLHKRRRQALIDPKVDLAKQPRGFGHKPWIVPLGK